MGLTENITKCTRLTHGFQEICIKSGFLSKEKANVPVSFFLFCECLTYETTKTGWDLKDSAAIPLKNWLTVQYVATEITHRNWSSQKTVLYWCVLISTIFAKSYLFLVVRYELATFSFFFCNGTEFEELCRN